MTKCCSGNYSPNFTMLHRPYQQHQTIDPLLVSISVLLQTHNGQMILERAPLSPKLLDSEIVRSQARTNTHKEWATERLQALDGGDTASVRRFSLSVKKAPRGTSKQGLWQVWTKEDQPTQPHGRPSAPPELHQSNITTFPCPLTELPASSERTLVFPPTDPTTPRISHHPTAGPTIKTTTASQHNNRINADSQPKAIDTKQASTRGYQILVSAPHTQRKAPTTYTETKSTPPYSMVSDERPSLHSPPNCGTTPRRPQPKSWPDGTCNADNWKWLPPNPDHDRFRKAKPEQPTQNLNSTYPNKEQSRDTPTKAPTTQNSYGLPRITKLVQCENPIREHTHHDTPQTAPEKPHILPTAENHLLRDNPRTHSRPQAHRNDRPDGNFQDNGNRDMDFDQTTNDRSMDFEQQHPPLKMILD